MKKITLAVALASLLSAPAEAKSPQAIGKIFAQLDACTIKGDVSKFEKGIIKLKISDKYSLTKRTKRFKRQITKGQFKEFERLGNGSPKWTKSVMCALLRDKWL